MWVCGCVNVCVWRGTQLAYRTGRDLSAGWPFSINQGPKSADVNKCGGKLVVATVSTTVTITAITTAMKTNWRGN